jgi:hypothetical protein
VPDGRLPNLIVIGAGKAGTTSLHHYLDQHPDVGMSDPKETYFFEREDYRDALTDYAQCFPEGTRIRGEATPSYSQYPRVQHIPERIRSVIPDARLIYLVRDPIDRAEAHYQQGYSVGQESRPMDEAFADVDDPYNIYACCSKYALQTKRYLEHFPRSSILIVENRDLADRPQETLSEIFAFLDVDPTFSSPRFSERLNTKEGKLRLSDAGTRVRESAIAGAARTVLPERIRARVFTGLRRNLSREVERVPLPDGLRTRLADALRDDATEFRAIAGRRFEHWSV